jgi:hypothetical protein
VDIRELLDDHLLACVVRQLAFSDLIGGGCYSVDLQEGSVSFFVGGRELRVGLIGSAAPNPAPGCARGPTRRPTRPLDSDGTANRS